MRNLPRICSRLRWIAWRMELATLQVLGKRNAIALGFATALLLSIVVFFASFGSLQKYDGGGVDSPLADGRAGGQQEHGRDMHAAAAGEVARNGVLHDPIAQETSGPMHIHPRKAGTKVDIADNGGESAKTKRPCDSAEHPWWVTGRDTNGDGTIQVNEYFDRVLYLNVDFLTERRDVMRALFAAHGIHAERFSQYALSNPFLTSLHTEYVQRSLNPFESRMKRGKLMSNVTPFAYLKSCEGLIRLAKQRGYRRILLLDDTVTFHVNFTTEFDRKVRLLPADWKLLYLGASQFMWHGRSLTWDTSRNDEFYHPRLTDGGFAVGIDASVYDILLFEMEKVTSPFDAGALRAVLAAFHKQSFVFYPNLVIRTRAYFPTKKLPTGKVYEDAVRWDMSLYSARPPPAPLPKVCIVVTFKNAQDTIAYSLDSLLRQTYTNIEIVAVDDFSDDQSAAIVEDIALKNNRITLLRNPVNVGTYVSRNNGLRLCTGEIYMNHDADDVSMEDRVATQIVPILDNRAEITTSLFIRAHIGIADFKYNAREVLRRANLLRVHKTNNDFKYCCKEKLGLMTTMIKVEVFNRIGYFDETRYSGDAEFLERYLALTMNRFITSGVFNIHTYLWLKAAPETLEPYIVLIQRTLLVAADLDNSITHSVPLSGKDRSEYEHEYRQKIVARMNPDAGSYNPFY